MKGKKEHITWSDSYSVGIKLLDDQHKGLFEIVNDLFDHSTGNEAEERAYFKEIIHQAVQYIKEHFATEEKIIASAKFPGYSEQKKAHDEFTKMVIKSVKDFESGKRLVLIKLAIFFKEWILAHIAIMDTQYTAYFREIAAMEALADKKKGERQ
jgi:hemerythrin